MADNIENAIFREIFDQGSHPTVLINADFPHFTIAAFNKLYQATTRTPTDGIVGKSAFEVYKPYDLASERQFALLTNALKLSLDSKKPYKLPILSFVRPSPNGRDQELSHWQIQIHPVLDQTKSVRFLKCTTFDITEAESTRISLEKARKLEQQLYEEIKTINEELAATNEELITSIEDLQKSQDALSRLNVDLEQRVALRTADLEASEKRHRRILNSLPQIAWTNNLAGEVEFYNKRWFDYTGLNFEQTKAWGWKEVIHPDDLQYNLDTYTEILNSDASGEFEIREKGADGIYRWHLVRIEPLRNEQGQIESWIGTATDIDQIKQLQQKKDDFISIASHELRTPLTSLKANLQLLDQFKNSLSAAIVPKLIERSNNSMNKIISLVDELLDVGGIKEGQLKLNKSTFILSELVTNCLLLIGNFAVDQIILCGDMNLSVYADEHRIEQVLINFLNNALKYAPESTIEISIERIGHDVKVSVKDNGPGIDKNDLAHLYKRYFQGRLSEGHANPGLGLGLYINAEIVRRHGGQIGAESTSGKGSVFWFTIPSK